MKHGCRMHVTVANRLSERTNYLPEVVCHHRRNKLTWNGGPAVTSVPMLKRRCPVLLHIQEGRLGFGVESRVHSPPALTEMSTSANWDHWQLYSSDITQIFPTVGATAQVLFPPLLLSSSCRPDSAPGFSRRTLTLCSTPTHARAHTHTNTYTHLGARAPSSVLTHSMHMSREKKINK